jgi:hypothetical protein
MTAAASPPAARQIVAGLVVAAFAVGVCWFVQWRSAPPPPPHPVGQFP